MSIGAVGSSEFVLVFSSNALYFLMVDSPHANSRAIRSDEKHQLSGFDFIYAKIAFASNGRKGQNMILFPSRRKPPDDSFFSIPQNGYI